MLKRFKKLHADERGLETLQVVAILAIAAIILALVKVFWTKIFSWFHTQSDTIDSGWKGEAGGGAAQ